jgi:hypothetical protein
MHPDFTAIENERQFAECAMDTFRYQAKNNKVYAEFLTHMGIKPETINNIEEIPFLPIEFFKSRVIICEEKPAEKIFYSSGTGGERSKHYVANIELYHKSFLKGFSLMYGDIEDYCVLALLPSYLERSDSSLVYMTQELIRKGKNPDSGFYLNNLGDLATKLVHLEEKKQKTLLLGVSYSLLDLIENHTFSTRYTTVMETGGMKGKRKEMVREELHSRLCDGFGTTMVHSEYGMTELLSQAYSKGKGIFDPVPWMRIKIRDINDSKTLLSIGKAGGINIIDLANYYSCSFIATQDVGILLPNNQFIISGRFDNSDIRGCNLMIV